MPVEVPAPIALLGLRPAGDGAAAPSSYPVPWTGDFSAQVGHPNAPPAGANHWDCEPSRRHPNPVILVHGLAANRTVNFPHDLSLPRQPRLLRLRAHLRNDPGVDPPGYQPGGLLRMQHSARKLKRFAARVLPRHRRPAGGRRRPLRGQPDARLVGQVPRRQRKVDDYVGITPLWDGTNLAGLGSLGQIGQALGFSEDHLRGDRALLRLLSSVPRPARTSSASSMRTAARGSRASTTRCC